tara:strand:- start:93 stop:203 length:111 start_codon:yes stop_codon:yes gene_type:complete
VIAKWKVRVMNVCSKRNKLKARRTALEYIYYKLAWP